jgi:hypothetical protein
MTPIKLRAPSCLGDGMGVPQILADAVMKIATKVGSPRYLRVHP